MYTTTISIENNKYFNEKRLYALQKKLGISVKCKCERYPFIHPASLARLFTQSVCVTDFFFTKQFVYLKSFIEMPDF